MNSIIYVHVHEGNCSTLVLVQEKTFATQVHPVEKHGGRNTGGVESSNKRLKSELQELKSWDSVR